MTTRSPNEIGSETGETNLSERRIETFDDIPREIAEKRIQGEFGGDVSADGLRALRESPDRIEKSGDFRDSAREAGLKHTEGVLGFSTRPEDPAHVIRGDVGREIATLIHEDLHRLTHPETLRDTRSTPELHNLYEGATERFTERAAAGLHGFEPGECYPEQVKNAEKLASEVGDQSVRDWFFKHELSEELSQALERIAS
jgi:hypothetical protein